MPEKAYERLKKQPFSALAVPQAFDSFCLSWCWIHIFFFWLASVVCNTSSVCAAVKKCDEPEIRDTTGMLGCGKGSKFGHFSSSGSSETCRNSGKNQVYVHCTLIKLSRQTDKVLLLFNSSLHSLHTMGQTFPLQNMGAAS